MKKLLVLFSALILFSCDDSGTNFNTVEVDGIFEIDVPDYLMKSDELSPLAIVQYANPKKEVYFIVINEDMEMLDHVLYDQLKDGQELLDVYTQIQIDAVSETLDLNNKPSPEEKTINGMEARIIEFEGVPDGYSANIFYYNAYIKGKKFMYLFSAWCYGSMQSTYKEDFIHMSESIKEI